VLCPPSPSFFPYTTLFRSCLHEHVIALDAIPVGEVAAHIRVDLAHDLLDLRPVVARREVEEMAGVESEPPHIGRLALERHMADRSEEHTSELQSLAYLVCR